MERKFYVPRGKIWLPDAIDILIRIRRNLAPDVRVPRAPISRIKETREVREALAEGDLAAIIIQKNGYEYPVPEKYWRQEDVEESLRTGYASLTVYARTRALGPRGV
jgi:hypothetical protein